MSCLGHQHPRVLAALAEQASALAYAHTGFFSTQVAEELWQKRDQIELGGESHVVTIVFTDIRGFTTLS